LDPFLMSPEEQVAVAALPHPAKSTCTPHISLQATT
jgi:hypothetical protein